MLVYYIQTLTIACLHHARTAPRAVTSSPASIARALMGTREPRARKVRFPECNSFYFVFGLHWFIHFLHFIV